MTKAKAKMTKAKAKRVLKSVFSTFSKREKGNLRYHAERGSVIACGDNAEDFFIPGGG